MKTDLVSVSERGKIVAVPCVTIMGRTVIVNGSWIRMAMVHDELYLKGQSVADPDSFVALLKKSSLKADIFSFSQALPDITPKHKYSMVFDNHAVIPITTFEQWWNALSQDSRRNVRIAAKRGVTVRSVNYDDAFVAGIKGIYDETPVRQGRPFWHFNKPFESVKQENATYLGQSEFIGAYLGDELAGFIKMVYVGTYAHIMQILSKDKYFDLRVSNALIAKAVGICSERGKQSLLYCKYTYEKKANSSITEFKRRTGFVEVVYPRYFVPLTVKGKFAIKTGLHLGVKSMLPQKVVNVLLKLRERYYQSTGAVSTKECKFGC